jgi:DHA1 family multidrug resistance protein-like MFS transporter
LRKWSVTFLVVLLSINVTFASSAPSSAVVAIASDLHVSEEVGFLVTSTFLIGYVFGPLVWGPGSELVGRRPVMILTVGVYTILHLGQALAPNIATLLVTRFLGGFCATAPLTNSGGLIADIFDPVGRGLATSLFTASVFLGPVLGPIVSAFVVESSLGWRWVFWIMMIFAGVCWVVSAVFLPETYAPVLLAQKARRMRKADPVASKDVYAEYERQDWSVRAVLRRSIFRPFEMLAQEPILVLITIYMAIIYGLLYAYVLSSACLRRAANTCAGSSRRCRSSSSARTASASRRRRSCSSASASARHWARSRTGGSRARTPRSPPSGAASRRPRRA